MSLTQASIGIDWGTHSSKWYWTRSGSYSSKVGFNIVLSDVRLEQAVIGFFLALIRLQAVRSVSQVLRQDN